MSDGDRRPQSQAANVLLAATGEMKFTRVQERRRAPHRCPGSDPLRLGRNGNRLAIARYDDDVDMLVRNVELHDRDDETAHLGEGLLS